jgi:hypothetical protein
MSNKPIIGSTPVPTLEWDQAWHVVSRLASARRDILADAATDKPAEWSRPSVATPRVTDPVNDHGAVDPEEFARAVAEIEQASAALRQAEPALETGVKQRTERVPSRRPHAVWLLIATLWLSTGLVIAGAVTAIAYFIH